MMSDADDCYTRAADLRNEAALDTTMPARKLILLEAAKRWEEIGERSASSRAAQVSREDAARARREEALDV